MITEILDGCWKACTEQDLPLQAPFVVDAVIVNRPSFAHKYCAEVLAVNVQLMFIMPWWSTWEFHILWRISNIALKNLE